MLVARPIPLSAVRDAQLPTRSTDALPHMDQLDAVRALAIFAVMACHFLPYRLAQEGARGVTLFFVLSGFLITGILLQCRKFAEHDGQPRLLTLRRFYVRRVLRIFPLYYLVLLVLWLMHDPGARTGIGWNLAYLGNIQHAVLGYRHQWPQMSVAHFWSLAVEEQFYLLWPWAVLFLSRRAILATVAAVILIGPAFRLLAAWLGAPLFLRMAVPLYWLDALGLGAMLAVMCDPAFGLRHLVAPARLLALAGGILGILAGLFLYRINRIYCVAEASYFLGYALVGAWLVSRAAEGFSGAAGRLMCFKPLRWIGTVSYGIYVYHMIVLTYWNNAGLHAGTWVRAAAVGALSLAIAAASYYVFENPLNRLKLFFPYRSPTPKKPSTFRPIRLRPAA